MKRRKFIQATLVGAAAATVVSVEGKAGERLYGAPGSVRLSEGAMDSKKFMLPLARSGVPVEGWSQLSSASQLIEDVLVSPKNAADFFKSPQEALRKYGLDASDKTLADETAILLTALTHPAVRDSLEKADYEATFSLMEAAGLLEKRDPSNLEESIQNIFSKNIDKILEVTNASKITTLDDDQKEKLLAIINERGGGASETDLTALVTILNSGSENPQLAVLTLVVVVSVAIAVIAAVFTHAAVAVSVMTNVMGGEVIDGDEGSKKSLLFDGSFGRFDPILMKNLERISRVGALKKDKGLQKFALQKLISEEVRAVLAALQKLGVLNIAPEQFSIIVDATAKYSYKALGIHS